MLNPLHLRVKDMLDKAILFSYRVYVLVFFVPSVLLAGAATYIAGFFGAHGDLARCCMARWAKINLALALLQVHIVGLERLNPESTYIFMANHASFLDILLVLAHVPHNFRFIVKKEFFSVPLLGAALRRCGEISIDRKNPWKALRSLKQAADRLKQGISIVVFPEGTRSLDGKIQDFKKALFILPIRSRIPVVPVLIEGTFQGLKRGSILLKPVPLKMTFYDPIPADSFEVRDRDLFAEKVRQILLSHMACEGSNCEAPH
jgi:1-acyl-sn-glycerol-3-phosphate acyltransferase